MLIHGATELEDAVEAAAPGKSLWSFLAPGEYLLRPLAMNVSGFNLTIAAAGEATLDAQHSQMFRVSEGAVLTLVNLRLVNGAAAGGGALAVVTGASMISATGCQINSFCALRGGVQSAYGFQVGMAQPQPAGRQSCIIQMSRAVISPCG